MIGAHKIVLLGVHVIIVLRYMKGGVPRVIGAYEIVFLGVHAKIVFR